jgi:hypothetical protein
MYFTELNSIFRSSDSMDNNKCLAIVYSFYIWAYVQRGLQIVDRLVMGSGPRSYASDRYLDISLALFGAMEKEDTLVGGRGSKMKRAVKNLRRSSDPDSDRSTAKSLLTKQWSKLNIRTTYRFLELHVRTVCTARVHEVDQLLWPLRQQQPPVFSDSGSRMIDSSSVAPSMTRASTIPTLDSFSTAPSVFSMEPNCHDAEQLPYNASHGETDSIMQPAILVDPNPRQQTPVEGISHKTLTGEQPDEQGYYLAVL